MAKQKTIRVIGGGIVGLATALALLERGHAVTLVDDATERPPASFGNVGHIATEQVAPLASWRQVLDMPRRLMTVGGPVSFPPAAIATWLPFGLRLLAAGSPSRFAHGKTALSGLLALALDAWRTRAARSGAAALLRDSGHLVAWESAATAKAGRSAIAATPIAGIACHAPTEAQMAVLRDRIRAPIADVVRYSGTASVTDPGAVLVAFRAAFAAAGGVIETAEITPETLHRTATDLTIVTAGVRSAALMRALGHTVPIVAERGYHIRSTAVSWPDDMPPIVFEDRAFVVSGSASGLRATSFVEFTEHDAPPDAKKWARLKQHAADLGLPLGDDVATWHGSRPTFPDYLPAIGRSRRDARVLYAFGHQHLGLTLAPITATLIADLVEGAAPVVPLAPFSLDRFG